MKLSSYILSLERILETEGDLDVECYVPFTGRLTARVPKVSYRRILKGREKRPDFWSSIDGDDRKGEKVVQV